MKGWNKQMQKNNIWLHIIASVGVGFATYYTIAKNNHSIGQTMQKVIPFVSQMNNGDDS